MIEQSKVDYRDLIIAEFKRRRKIKQFYSVRQYAADLDLEPMHVSYLLRKKRGLSKDNALRVGGAIGLKSIERQFFRFLVTAQSGRSNFERKMAEQGLNRTHFKGLKNKFEEMCKAKNGTKNGN